MKGQQHSVEQPERVSFHLVTQDKGAATDKALYPPSKPCWMRCYSTAVCAWEQPNRQKKQLKMDLRGKNEICLKNLDNPINCQSEE